MNEIVSFDGVLKIWSDFKRKNFDDIPKNWKQMIEHYIKTKQKMIPIKRKRGIDVKEDEFKLIRAMDILDDLKWMMK